MTLRYRACGLVGFLAVALLIGSTAVPAQDLNPVDDPVEVQTTGPIHEAYAQPGDDQVAPTAPVPKAPPAAIQELPPDEQPEDAEWIGGYWAWDAEQQDFLWVSGVYRVPPPSRRWVPGYWTESAEGWRWVPGVWAGESQEELPYTPEPPATLEAGPSLPAPDADSIYVPGSWAYREERFLWRPGHWAAGQPGRIWTAPRYCWTPRGHLYVDGFWDHPLEDRGLLFAPVAFRAAVWNQPGWAYRPSHCFSPPALLTALFCRPGSGHYHFGNYYGAHHARLGYRPWFDGPRRGGDTLYNHYRWQNRDNPRWAADLRRDHDDRAHGRVPPPPRTLVQQNRAGAPPVVTPLGQTRHVKLVKTDARPVDRTRDLGNLRRLAETKTPPTAPRSGGALVTERKTLKLPIAAPRPTPRVVEGKAAPRTPPVVSPKSPPRVVDTRVSPPNVVNRPAPVPTKTSPPTPRTVEGPKSAPRGPTAAPPVTRPLPPAASPKTAPRTDAAPRIATPNPVPPKVAPPAAPRITAPNPTPRVAPPVTPKAAPPTPRIVDGPKAAPRVVNTPPAARTVPPTAARVTAPPPPRPAPPRVVAPAPRVAPRTTQLVAPKAVPRIVTPPPTSRAAPPAARPAAPRVAAPAPAPRAVAPAARTGAPRVAAPAPRPAAGRKR